MSTKQDEIPQANLYMTPYGPVRISEREVTILETAARIDRDPHGFIAPLRVAVIGKAEAIKEACHRFAEYQSRGL